MGTNIDQSYINKVSEVLLAGKTILYPTDTVWGLGCDATNDKAVSKIYKIKKREESKSLIILVSSLSMLKEYVNVPKNVIKVIKESIKPTTIIYQNPIGISGKIINKEDNSVAIRIVKDDFCQKLITQFGKPIVSTSANISGEDTPNSFEDISEEVKLNTEFIVSLLDKKQKTIKPSTILKINKEGLIITLRA
ncbi:L-threonylcarbamoyladenylate synthase [Tenacibaculum sp. nBUS_03]|uniref:L-threonylcarbamoyladenylate synthase n=1 Tax=Tenacibaculum sp. nBUS_03 TaxID=3395320 RepID=UPI003EBD96CD